MGVAKRVAIGLGRLTRWSLHTLARRPASQLPGRVALAIDPHVIGELAGKLRKGSIVVCGTNGKTTTTNMLADAIEASGQRVLCNREGANMAPGVACALLPGRWADWAVIESDELSTVHVLPALRPTYLVLLNLFRDQLDRAGEIDHVQDTIVRALASSPETALVVCGDDPLCVGVALRAAKSGTKVLAFGMGEDLGLEPDRVPEARFCQVCGAELAYSYRSYAQLGAFRCPNGDFARPELDYVAKDVRVEHGGVTLEVDHEGGSAELSTRFGGVYMAYNVLAAYAASTLANVSVLAFQRVLDSFSPDNGRLQHFQVGSRDVTLNLAKNPTGFNQNLSLLAQDPAPKAAYVVVNDNYNDGRDVSWIWDVDFERLAHEPGITQVTVGGHRANDLQVRMKYAGVDAPVTKTVSDALAMMPDRQEDTSLYVLCNYSALAPAKAELETIAKAGVATRHEKVAPAPTSAIRVPPATHGKSLRHPHGGMANTVSPPTRGTGGRKLVVAHLYPELLNLYGDSGNILCLRRRLEWRGIEAQVREVHVGDVPSFGDVDLVFIGGGSDREQRIVCDYLLEQREELFAYVEDGGVLAAVCGGYQLLGDSYLLDDEKVGGLSLVDLYTDRGSPRIIGNIAIKSDIAPQPIVGYENHGGRTHLGPGVRPLGRVLHGHGNDTASGHEGCSYKNVIGTYIHGPLLPKNPGVADWLIARAIERRYGDAELEPLDDTVELEANRTMVDRLSQK